MRNIIQNFRRGKSISWLSNRYGVSKRRIRQIIAYFKQYHCLPTLQKRGRKPKVIPVEEVKLILSYREISGLGPVALEKLIELETGRHIPHNRIYKVLKQYGLSIPDPKKQKQRSYKRYERKHSMSLWHGDWMLFRLNGREHWLIAFIDDSSRLVTCYGVYERATASNTVDVLKKGIAEYGIPDAIVTDNGTQFVSLNSKHPMEHEFSAFLRQNNIKHIRAHPGHPQTNGKVERLFKEVERRIGTQFKSIEEFVKWQNEVKPHRGLNYERPMDAFFHRLRPERILAVVGGWFYHD